MSNDLDGTGMKVFSKVYDMPKLKNPWKVLEFLESLRARDRTTLGEEEG